MVFFVTQVKKETSWHIMWDAVSYRYSFVQIHAGQLSATGESMGFWFTASAFRKLPSIYVFTASAFRKLPSIYVFSYFLLVLRAGCGI